ncbi:MAG: winged helix-turn-helix domain-containing protein [Candidatus Limnocylindrales bacterium]
MREIRPAQHIWLQDGGVPFFGGGVRELLVRTERTGSLHQAAAEMGMAYSKAWGIVHRAEEHLGLILLERRAGGVRGGGSTLSDDGRWMVEAFGAFREEAAAALAELYGRHFGDRFNRFDGPSAHLPDPSPADSAAPGQAAPSGQEETR